MLAMSERVGAWSGVVAAVLILGGFAAIGPAPAPAEPASELARHLTENRTRILTGDVLVGAGAVFYLCFLAALQARLRSPTILAGGAMAMTIVVAGVALQSALVLEEATLDSDAVVRLGFDGYNALITIAGFGFALTAAATAGAAGRSGALPGSLAQLGWPVAALQLLTIPGLIVTSGFFAPAHAMPVLAFWALAVWSAAVAVVMIRR